MAKKQSNLGKFISGSIQRATQDVARGFAGQIPSVIKQLGWDRKIDDPFTGAWQRNLELTQEDSTRYFAVYSCLTLISSDIGKLPFVVKKWQNHHWAVQRRSPYSWLNIRPNHFQTPSKFREQWILSKLMHGNTYGLKKRNQAGEVEAIYILDPTRVTPLVSDTTSEVFYRLSTDNLSGLKEDLVVPASEIIHDRMNCLYHPLIGIPPMYAALASATLGIHGQEHMAQFLRNASNPGGILIAPGAISELTAKNLKAHFDNNYSGRNAGRVAVVGDGLKFEKLAISSHDSQLIEHMKWSAEAICAVFHVPTFMVLGDAPSQGTVAAMREQYYGQCLQALINSMNESLDDGLDVGEDWAIEVDLNELLRADTTARFAYLSEGIKGSIITINEARAREDLPPVEGGDSVYMQQQNYSLSALAERDRNSPLLEQAPAVSPAPAPAPEPATEEPTAAPAPAPKPVVEPTAAPVVESTPQMAMHGGQITSLMSVLDKVSTGQLPLESAMALILATFPTFTEAQVSAMLVPLVPVSAPAEDDDDEEEQVRLALAELQRSFMGSDDTNTEEQE